MALQQLSSRSTMSPVFEIRLRADIRQLKLRPVVTQVQDLLGFLVCCEASFRCVISKLRFVARFRGRFSVSCKAGLGFVIKEVEGLLSGKFTVCRISCKAGFRGLRLAYPENKHLLMLMRAFALHIVRTSGC